MFTVNLTSLRHQAYADAYDPTDYEEFDPAELPDDAVFSDDTPLNSVEVMAIFAGFALTF